MAELYIGLMSGTSMDAIDGVLADFSQNQPKIIAAYKKPFASEARNQLLKLVHQNGPITFAQLTQADVALGHLFADTVQSLIAKANISNTEVLAIGSHGQTVYHHPHNPHATSIQIGDPNIIVETTRITTIADFRRRDIAASGQGAPLVPGFHDFAFRSDDKNRTVLNIGGIANLTVLSKGKEIRGFDTGPGNMLMDAWASLHIGKPYDDNGSWAATGMVNDKLLHLLLKEPYFSVVPPKSTGRELFNLQWLERAMKENKEPLKPEDVQATLCTFTAKTIAEAIYKYAPEIQQVIVCGGGAYNQHLVSTLQQNLIEKEIFTSSALGVEPDHVEALAFAWLAKQTIEKKPGNIPSVTGARHPVVLGAIYHP